MSLGRFGRKFAPCLDLSSQNVFPELPLKMQLLEQGPSWDPNLNVFGQVWAKVGILPGPVQSECVSIASLSEAAFGKQVPAGIPT